MRRSGAPAVARLSLLEGADRASGMCVVIDVFRAGTFACLALEKGAEHVIPAGTVEEARALKARNPAWILAGERGGSILPGFDTGNSPTLLLDMDLIGRTVIHATSAGTRGLLRARTCCDTVLMACFANAGAAARYVLSAGARRVTLVAMGDDGTTPATEDEEFAAFFESALVRGGRLPDPGPWLARIRRSGAPRRFEESVDPSMPPADVQTCLSIDTAVSVPLLGTMADGTPALTDAFRDPAAWTSGRKRVDKDMDFP